MPKLNQCVAALPVSICQRMGYDWIVSDVTPGGFKGKRVLDFGANGYPFIALLAKWGAEVWWHDRDLRCAATMEKLAKQWGVRIREQKALVTRPEFDIVIASNAIQHNHDGAVKLYQRLRDNMKPDGVMYVVEALEHGQSRWDTSRKDPCWRRTLADHAELWKNAGLRLIRTGLFSYASKSGDAPETSSWVSPINGKIEAANRVCARLERAC